MRDRGASGVFRLPRRGIPPRLNRGDTMNIVIVLNAESLVAVLLLVRMLQHLV